MSSVSVASPPTARRLAAGAVVASLVTGLMTALNPAPEARAAAPVLLSQGRAATASSTEAAPFAATASVDGDLTGTRWSSQWQDGQWIQTDLGRTAELSRAVLTWEAAYGKSYQIQASDDGADWRTLTTVTAGDGGTDDLALSGSGRYVRMNGLTQRTGYGFSLWEFQVYGTKDGDGGPTLPGGGDLGPNVHIFDSSTPGIQAKPDEVFRQQESAQFGAGRHAFLFNPTSPTTGRRPRSTTRAWNGRSCWAGRTTGWSRSGERPSPSPCYAASASRGGSPVRVRR